MTTEWMTDFWAVFTECVIEMDADYRITNLHRKPDSSLVLPDIIGNSFLNIAEEKDVGFVESKLDLLKSGAAQYARFPFLSKLGRYYRWTLIPFEKDGVFAGCHGVAVDVTQATLNEKLLEEARAEAEAANAAKSLFLSRMSHEIRTPMNAIIGMINIGLGSEDGERKNYCFKRADDAAKHLLEIINDILDMSKIEADKLELLSMEFDFQRTLKNIAGMAAVRAEEKEQRLIVNYAEDVPSFIVGDELRLSQVVTNLLTNAIKFTPEKGAVVLTVKKLEDVGDEVILLVEVSDTGIGISEEQQSRLFTPFNQANASISQSFGGTGLGLAISKRIVEMMGGVIWVESRLGEGARFIFTIRTKRIDRVPVPEQYEEGPGDKHPNYDFGGKTILIAEDVDINREILSAVLAETGVGIEYAENGCRAVSMFRAEPEKYALILMDINMPEMDGYEATERIREMDRPRAKEIPIIAMTANVFKEDIEKCIETGMNDHIGKPIDADDLFFQLNKYLFCEEDADNDRDESA